MSFSFDRKYLVSLLISLLLFAVLASLAVRSVNEMHENVHEVDRAYRVQATRAALLEVLLDLEAGQRGYLITRDPAYLQPYERALPRLEPALDELEALTGSTEDLKALRRLAAIKQQHSARVVALAASDPEAARALIMGGAGKQSMDGMRATLDRMAQAERSEIARQSTEAEESMLANRNASLLVLAAWAGSLIVIYLLMRRELAVRRRLAQAERMAVARLESRVEERTQALQETSLQLQVSEAQLRGIFDSAHEAILTVNEQQTVVMANLAAAQVFGLPLEQLVGSPLDAYIPPGYRAAHRDDVNHFRRTASGPRVMGRRAQVTAVRADGSEFPVEAAISYLHVDGQHLHTVVLRDVTEQLRAHRALQDSELRLRTLLDMLPEAVFVNAGNKVSYANRAAQRLFGLPRSELLSRSPLQLFHPDSQALVRRRIEQVMRDKAIMPLAELQIVDAGGAARTVESTATLIEQDGQESIVVVLRDVSELRLTQAALAASNADLQRLLKSQGEVQEEERKRIARELHDDLQQTLAAIKMDVMAAAAAPNASASAQTLLANAHALADGAIVSTRRIINDLRPQMLDDLGLLAALQALAGGFSQRTGMACVVVADELGSEAEDLASPLATCLYRVAQESLNNVAKHARASRVVIELQAADGHIVLRVQDDGHGIRPADLGKSGSFGLLGMQERTRAVGGTLTVQELPGGGTLVEATAPLGGVAAPPGDVAAPPARD